MKSFRQVLVGGFIVAGLAAGLCVAASQAQTPAQTPTKSAAASPAKTPADLRQLMRGIMFPNSNVIFAAQDDLGKFKPAEDPSTSPNPLTSTYGGWRAVENASLALAETADLLMIPGRLCSNGKPVPLQRADWKKYVQGLKDAGLAAYKAAQSKNQDMMVDVAGTLSDACAACHDVYREKDGGEKDRCLP